MMDLDTERNELLARLKELQTQAVQLDSALQQAKTEIAKTIGALECLAKIQQRQVTATDARLPQRS